MKMKVFSNYKKIVFFSTLLFFSIFFFRNSYASHNNTIHQTVSTATSTEQASTFYELLDPASVPTGLSINSVQLTITPVNTGGIGTLTVSLERCTGGFSGSNCVNSKGEEITNTISFQRNGQKQTIAGTFIEATTTLAESYRLYTSSASNFYIHGSTNSNSLTNATTSSISNPVNDIYFILGNEIAVGTIRISVPATSGSVVDDVLYWGVKYNYSSSSQEQGFNNCFFLTGLFPCQLSGTYEAKFSVGVRYGTTTNSLNTYNDWKPLPIFGFASTTINKENWIPPGDYFAQAYIVFQPDCGDVSCPDPYFVATSTTISVTVTDPFNPDVPPFLSNLFEGQRRISLFGDDPCDDLADIGSTTIRNFIECLFQPRASTTDAFKTVLQDFTGFFPFNVFFDFKNTTLREIENQTGTTGLPFDVVISTPANRNNEVRILTPTSLEDNFGSTTKDKWFEIQRNVIWLATGILMLAFVL